jgi:sortase A
VSAPVTLPIRAPGEPDRGRTARGAARGVGELFITLGVLLLLLCIYQLWWTNVESARATVVERDQILSQWQDPTVAPPASAAIPVVQPVDGQGFALLYIPRLRDKVWGLPVIEGVGLDVLAKGAGHYPRTAVPGQVGNFAIAAHRATHNEPFRDIDQLQVGDKVYVRTQSAWYTYVLDRDKIVQPTDTWVVGPVPGKPGVAPTEKLITLTTCNPRWASYQRWIWWGHQRGERAVAQGPPPAIAGKV